MLNVSVNDLVGRCRRPAGISAVGDGGESHWRKEWRRTQAVNRSRRCCCCKPTNRLRWTDNSPTGSPLQYTPYTPSGQLSLLPSAGREWVVAYGLRAVVCLLAANRGSNCSLTRAMDGRIVRCGIVSSSQSAATSEIVKRFWSRTHVRSAISVIATFTLTLFTAVYKA